MTRLEALRGEAARTRRPRPPRRPFSAALRDAGRAVSARPRPEAGPGARPYLAKPAGRPGRAGGRPGNPGEPLGEVDRFREARPTTASPGVPTPTSGAEALRAAVRALPPAAVALRGQGGGALALDLGHSLSVELRSAPDGVEVVLRPVAALSRAAAAELPELVRALRARGVEVARAEVRARGGPRRVTDG